MPDECKEDNDDWKHVGHEELETNIETICHWFSCYYTHTKNNQMENAFAYKLMSRL